MLSLRYMQIVFKYLLFKLSFTNINFEVCIFLLDVCLVKFNVRFAFYIYWSLSLLFEDYFYSELVFPDAFLIYRFDRELNKEVAIKVIDLEES